MFRRGLKRVSFPPEVIQDSKPSICIIELIIKIFVRAADSKISYSKSMTEIRGNSILARFNVRFELSEVRVIGGSS